MSYVKFQVRATCVRWLVRPITKVNTQGIGPCTFGSAAPNIPKPRLRQPTRNIYTALNAPEEKLTEYCPGGYHPVLIGDVYNETYRIIRKIGWGQFSTVWLCKDSESGNYAALKISKGGKNFKQMGREERDILANIRDRGLWDPYGDRVIQLLGDFTLVGPSGNHNCLIFETVGCNLFNFMLKNNYNPLPLEQVRTILIQLLQGLDFLHRKCFVVHTDIKPENILLSFVDAKKVFEEIDQQIQDMLDSGVDLPNYYISTFEKHMCANNKTQDLDSKYTMNSFYDFKCRGKSFIGVNNAIDAAMKVAGDRESSNQNAHLNTSTDNAKKADLSEDRWRRDPYYEAMRKLYNCRLLRVKIADLGNACFDSQHYTDEIQTRQYRAVEVILGAEYSYPVDIWSVGCLGFEIAVGDYLYNPKPTCGCSVNEEHLSLILVTVGRIPTNLITRSKRGYLYFDLNGDMRNNKNVPTWQLPELLMNKYGWEELKADRFAQFLHAMLDTSPERRATALKLLEHPWVRSGITNIL